MEAHSDSHEEGQVTHHSASNAPNQVWKIGALVVALFLTIIFFKYGLYSEKKSTNIDKSGNKTEQTSSNNDEELMFSGKTPCETYIDYKNTIKTDGKPVYIKYTGVKEKVYYCGTGDLYTPGVQCGPVYIESAEGAEINVQVYKVK